MRRLAIILTLLATILSGGGVARFAHMMTAHGGVPCGAGHLHETQAPGNPTPCRAHAHAAAHSHTPADGAGSPHGIVDDDCPVCDELASLTPSLALGSCFTSTIGLLAILHDRAASQIPAPMPLPALGARPPPAAA